MTSELPLSAHLRHLGFLRDPFPVTPGEHGIFFSPRLAEQFTELLHVIAQRKGFMLVTGDVGVGKSTLARALLTRLAEERARTALVFNTFLQGADLLRAINRDFGVTADGDSLEALLQALNAWLLRQHALGRNCVLILDDAQGLDVPSLELVRQLSNLEASQAKLLQIVMVAQPEIRLTLGRHDMRQLASRVALRLELSPLTVRELDVYLHHRLQWAGRPDSLTVDHRALRRLHRCSRGYIRRVHLLLDRCLYGLVTKDSTRISAPLVDAAAQELNLQPPRRPWPRRLRLAGGIAGAGLTVAAMTVYLAEPDLSLHWAALAPPADSQTKTRAETETETRAQTKTQAEAETPAETIALPPATRPAPPPAADPQRLAEWQAFAALHAPLPRIDTPPRRWPEVIEWLPAPSDAQPWVPILLPSEWPMGCHAQPLYPLDDGKLALFRTSLPTKPQPFGQAADTITALQQALAELALLTPEAIDGVMGPRTAAALARFQKSQDLMASGQPDTESAYLLSCLAGGAP